MMNVELRAEAKQGQAQPIRNVPKVSSKFIALEKEMGETNEVIVGFCDELGIRALF